MAAKSRPKQNDSIAIIGMACRFPGAQTPSEFWDLLKNGVNAVQTIPPQRWDIDRVYDPNPGIKGKTNTRWGGFLQNVAEFDAPFFNIAPREAKSIDPQQRLLLEVTWEAFENAGLVPQALAGSKTGVFIGIGSYDYGLLQPHVSEIEDHYSATGNVASMAANRLSYVFDFRGPSMAVDTACSSSLVAVYLACQSLHNGDADLAVAGGVNLILVPEVTVALSQGRMLSSDGCCKAFDAAADGYVRSEGCGVVILKRLSDAKRAGDRIEAVIAGAAVNQDGRSKGLTAPSKRAQRAVIVQALQNAGVSARQIGYVECHGTGTPLGDAVEAEAITEALGPGRTADTPCILGSVKTNIGHLETAAGIAGLIKTVLTLGHAYIPPHLHLKKVNPALDLSENFRIAASGTPWHSVDGTRLAGVNSFGFGGTNAHMILRPAPSKRNVRRVVKKIAERPYHLLTLSAKTPTSLVRLAHRFARYIEHSGASPTDICYSANVKRTHFDHRLTVLAATGEEFSENLNAYVQKKSSGVQTSRISSAESPKIAFLFTGPCETGLSPGIRLYHTQPTFRKVVQECDRSLRPYLQPSLISVLYGKNTRLVSDIRYARPALFALEYALARLWQAWGIRPDVLLGYSLGEYVAACLAGVFSLQDALRLVAGQGRLLAAGNPKQDLNSHQPRHTEQLDAHLPQLEKLLHTAAYQALQIPLVSTVTAEIMAPGQTLEAGYWQHQLREPVRYQKALAKLEEFGCSCYLEIGPQPHLRDLARQGPANFPADWLASLAPGHDDWRTMLASLARLYLRNATVNWQRFEADYPRRQVQLPNYAFDRRTYWVGDKPAAADRMTVTAPAPSSDERRQQVTERLRRIIAAALEMDPESIEIQASFMDLGADSLTFTDVLFKIEDKFQMEIPVEKFFDELSTLSALSDYILANMSAPEAANSQDLPARFQGRSLPLSDRQQDVWQLSQVSANGHLSNNELSVLRFNVSVDVEALQAAFQAVVDRHEALRTFISADGTQQTVLAALPVALQQTDFSHCSPETREIEIIQWIRNQRRVPFDLSCAPLWRTAILKSDESEYLLMLIVHHILFDGLSFEVFFKDLLHCYTAITAGRLLQLPDPMQYREFVALEMARQVQPGWGAQKKYWHAALADPPSVADLPLDAARPPEMTYRGSCYGITLDRELAEALKTLSRQAGASLFMTLLAGYFTLLHRLTGRQDLIISINLARRNYKTARHMIGYCSDMMAVRHRLEGNVPFNELLQKIKKTVLAIFKHQDYPFCHVYERFGAPDSSRNGLLTSMFALQRATAHSEIAGAGLDLNEKAVTHSKMDFYANIVAIEDSLRVQFMYNPDLFQAETVARWMGHFVTLLGDIVQYPAKPVYTLALLTAAENKQLLAGWNDTRKAFPVTATFKDLFEAQVQRTPQAIALTDRNTKMTYAELNARANRLARALRQNGVRPGALVALIGERDHHFAESILAVFKLGAAYMPLDPRLPVQRLADMVRRSQTPYMLMTSSNPDIVSGMRGVLDGDGPQVLDQHDLLTETHNRKNLAVPAGADDLAYVMFTSGSTGTPKGAMIRQAGMLNHMYSKIEDLGMTAADTLAHMAPQGFDISVWQYLAPLLVGARVHIFPDTIAFNPVKHLKALGQAGVSIYQVVPSLLQRVVHTIQKNRYTAPALPKLRWVVPTGEVLPPDLCRQWLRYYPHIPILNTYGPTECSDDVAHHVIEWPPLPESRRVPIGKPIGNTRLYVLDPYLNPVPVGVVGELYVGGIGVGLGYLNDRKRTNRAFIANPFRFESIDGPLLYKTGDLVRRLADGTLDFIGRRDHQLKINGIRIEPAEVECALRDYPNLQQAAVALKPASNGQSRLVAYVVFGNGKLPSANALRRFLRKQLPPGMIPHVFVSLESLPVTSSGKFDPAALPDPESAPLKLESNSIAPRSRTEKYLHALWQKVLHHDVFGIEDDIFELTESLQAIQIASQIEDEFGIQILLTQMFQMGTIAKIARHIDESNCRDHDQP